MFKKESIYTNDGELVTSRTTQFKGRFDDKKGYSAYYNGKMIMSRVDAVFPENVGKTDIANLVLLSKHLQPKTNHLAYKGNKSMKPMDASHMSVVIGQSEPQTKRFIKRMIDHGVMASAKYSRQPRHYYINPIYFLNGRNISDDLYWMFQRQLDHSLPSWVQEEYRARKGDGLQ